MNPKFVIGIIGVVFAIVFGGAMTASYNLGRASKAKEYAETNTGLTVERVKNDFQIVEDERKLNEANENETGSDLDIIRATIKRVREHPASQ